MSEYNIEREGTKRLLSSWSVLVKVFGIIFFPPGIAEREIALNGQSLRQDSSGQQHNCSHLLNSGSKLMLKSKSLRAQDIPGQFSYS